MVDLPIQMLHTTKECGAMLRQELLLFSASHGGDLAETFGLENCHRASVLGLNKPPGVSRITGRHLNVGHAT